MIKNFTVEQKKIRSEWLKRQQQQDPESVHRYLNAMENAFRTMLGG